MAFTNPNPGRQLTRTDAYSKLPFIGAIPQPTSGSDFGRALGDIVGPKLQLNAQVNFNIGGNKNTSNSYSGKGGGSGGGRSNGRPHKNGKSGNSSGYYLPSNTNTASVTFETGIHSGTIINPFASTDCNENSNLFIMAGEFLPDSSKSGTTFESLFVNDIYYKFLTVIQREVNYRTSQEFTQDRFLDYIISLSKALQLYYCVDSVLAFDVDINNTNTGMRSLRSKLTAQYLSQHERLRRALLDVAIPRNLLSFIAFMYQNFKFDDTKYSPIFKLEFNQIFHSSSPYKIKSSLYDGIINGLRLDTQIPALLLKSFPSMKLEALPPSSSEPIYDANFQSFWYNSNVSYLEKNSDSVSYSQVVIDENINTYYGHFCDDDLDGIFYACASLLNLRTEFVSPGLWSPLQDLTSYSKMSDESQRSSILCYCSTRDGFFAPTDSRTASQSGIFSLPYYNDKTNTSWVVNQYVHPSAQEVQTHDLTNLEQALSQSILFLFSTE